MNDETIVVICVFIVIVLLHTNNYSCHAEGYTGRNPLATYLSLPDNVSEPQSLPQLPYYTTPNETNAITNYIYNSIDGSSPTIYAYNSNDTPSISGMTNRTGSYDIYGPYGGTFAGAQSEGFTPRPLNKLIEPRPLNKLIEPRPPKNKLLLNTLQFGDGPTIQYPSKKNPFYLPQINTPIEPGWRY